MTQPSGRICGTPSRYRTYLRCSPVICFADCLSIVFRFIVYSLYLETGPSESLRLLLRDRFNDVSEDKKSTDGLHALEKLTFLRWSFFVLGALFPAVKLAAMGGVPFTKAWGLMFLISFVFVEVLVIFSWYHRKENPDEQARIFENSIHNTLAKLDESLTKTERWLLAAACLFHTLIILTAISDLWPRPDTTIDLPQQMAMRLLMEISLVVCAGSLSVFPYLAISYLMYISFAAIGLSRSSWGEAFPYRLYYTAAFPLTVVVALSSLWYVFGGMMIVWMCIDIGWVTFLLSPVAWFPLICHLICNRFPRFANLLSLRDNDLGGFDIRACYSLLLFLYSLGVCILWYAYAYDPAGTSNPSWTAIFG